MCAVLAVAAGSRAILSVSLLVSGAVGGRL